MDDLTSIIITTFGNPQKLKRAIVSALRQTYESTEIIVVDDNDPSSTERMQTEALMFHFRQEPKIRYIKHAKNMNGAAARNTGIFAAKGVYLSFLDNDDIYCRTRIEKCVSKMKEKHCAAVYSDVLLTWDNIPYRRIKSLPKSNLQKELLLNSCLLGTGSNLFILKQAAENIGMFDERFNRYQDVEFMLRFFNRFRIANIPEILTVKDCSDNKMPPFMAMHEMNELFFKTFSSLISGISGEEQRQFYNEHYTLLLELALNEKNQENLYQAVSDLKTIRELTSAEKKYIRYHKAFLFRRRTIQIIKKNRFLRRFLFLVRLKWMGINSRSLVADITKKEYRQILSDIKE